jgi:hypothetical protein
MVNGSHSIFLNVILSRFQILEINFVSRLWYFCENEFQSIIFEYSSGKSLSIFLNSASFYIRQIIPQ